MYDEFSAEFLDHNDTWERDNFVVKLTAFWFIIEHHS